MDPVHDRGVHGPGLYFEGPGPWTRSTEGVHGPGVHVLYFPTKTTCSLESHCSTNFQTFSLCLCQPFDQIFFISATLKTPQQQIVRL